MVGVDTDDEARVAQVRLVGKVPTTRPSLLRTNRAGTLAHAAPYQFAPAERLTARPTVSASQFTEAVTVAHIPEASCTWTAN